MATNTIQTTAASPVTGNTAAGVPANGQPAVANGAAVQVAFPNGQNIVRVEAAPGEVITLPFDGDFAAKVGEQGNLAIKVGDQTVILQGYSQANQQENVTVKDDKGHVVDVAAVLASTDPNLDIQTAAGPTAGASGRGGSGLFFSDQQGAGLGGFGELGTINQTDLQYRLISPDANTSLLGNAAVSLTVPALGAAGTDVDEAGLPQGSHHGDGSSATSGIVTVSAPDGVAGIEINGVTLTADQLGHLSSEPQTITTPEGSLTLTGWDGAQLSYTYTLTSPTKGDNTSDSFTITVTDRDGDTGTGTLVVDIHDDVPTAHNDALTVAAGDYAGHQGNVITATGEDSASGADVKGADDATVTHVTGSNGDADVGTEGTAVIQGAYGTLTIAADGSYTYTRSEGTPGGVDDSFQYTLTDRDGDTSTATLTIHITDATPTLSMPEAGSFGTTVFEAGLPDGSGISLLKYTAGTFTYGQGDGPASVTINGVAIAAGTQIQGEDGTLTIVSVKNGVVTYVYELTHNTSGDHTHDDFNVVVTDQDGDKAAGSLVVDIVDDTPTARNDVDYVSAGSYAAETGNVISGAGTLTGIFGHDSQGADGASISKIVGAGGTDQTFDNTGHLVIAGQYGTLTIAADGSYSYQRNPGTPGGVNDVFTYTLTDGDGDSSTATLTIGIGDARPGLHVPGEGASGAKVYESGLDNGSHAGNGSNATSGTITYSQGDGPATVTINGHAVHVGDTITTADGTLHIDSFTNGTIGYTYTLNTHTSGDHTADTFSVVVTDMDGDKASGNLTIDIVDDVPTARNDSGEVLSGTYSVTGNVVANDTKGADGASVSSITGYHGSSDASFDSHGHLVVTGQYGTLTISADGSYTYIRNAGTPGGVTDSFNYILKDGDGDTSSATLTISIDDAKPSLHLPATNDAGTSVNEAGLANGSHHGDHSNITTGTITYTQGDGPATVTVNGHIIHVGDTIQGADGNLHIDSIANGSIGYTYTLTGNTSGDHTADTFAIVVSDVDGDKANGSLTIDIVDDVPTARNDSGEVGAGNYTTTGNVVTNDTKGADGASISSITGNNGASDASFDNHGHLVVTGQYGTLTISADGSYTYSRNPGTPGGGTDSFGYTLKDGDGDTSNATLTIRIDDAKPTLHLPDCDSSVDEAGLSNGSHHGDHSNITSGTITYTQGDGPATVTINGQTIHVGDTIQGQDGTLHIDSFNNGAIGYTYTLTSNTNGDHTSDNFSVSVSDVDGDKANGTLTIDIVDDTPTARNDSGEVQAGSYSVTGNVIANDTKGADGASVSGISGYHGASDATFDSQGHLIVAGQYGTLIIFANGDYTYTRTPGTPGGVTDSFTYTLKDGDGDISSAKLTISVDDAKPTLHLPTAQDSGTSVNEAGLGDGSHHGDHSNVTTGTITYTQGDGPATVTINGHTVHVGDTIQGQDGALHIDSIANGSIGYTYTLTDNTNGDHTSDSFAVVVGDVDGDKASGNLTINIVDDVPTARDDTGEIHAGLYSIIGNVVANDTKGADGATVSSITGYHGVTDTTFDNYGNLVIAGQYGTLTIAANGSYTYNRNPGTPGGVTDTFNYTLKDGDGDTSSAKLTISVDDATPTLHLPATNDAGTSVNEAGLAKGSHHGDHSNITTGTITYTQGDGPATVTINGQAIHVGDTIPGQDGSLHIDSINNGTIGYTYTLTGNTSGDHTADSFTVSVKDQDNETASGNLTINIVDDAPTANNDALTIGKGDYSVHQGNVITATGEDSLSGADVKGADGATVTHIQVNGSSANTDVATNGSTSIHGLYGTLLIAADGSYTYTRDVGTPGGKDDVFTYTLKDGDGDTSTASLTIHIGDATPTLHVPSAGDAGTSVNEAGLANGTHHGDGSNVTTGTFTYTEGDGPATISINGQTVHVGDTVPGADGSLHIDSIANGTIGYTYTLTTNTSGDHTADTFAVSVKDQDSETASGNLTINIVDDAPIAADGAMTVNEDGIASGHLGSPGIPGGAGDTPGVGNTGHISLANLIFGADGGHVSFDTSAQPAVTSDGLAVQYRTEVSTVNGHEVDTLVGYISYHSDDNNSTTNVDVLTLTVDPTNKTADFDLLQPLDHPNTTTEDNLSLGLKYDVTDGDGDKATGTITVTVNDDSPTAGTVSSPTVTEPGTSGNSGAAGYEVDATNYTNNAHFTITAGCVDGNGNLTTIAGDTPSINTNPAADGTTGLGVTSNTDGSGSARFDEINYLGNGSQHYDSEAMIVHLTDAGKVATSATVNLSEFYANEGGVGDEKGAYILYKDGVAVSGWTEFEANNTNGQMTLNITGPASGFDEVRFIAIQGSANPNGNAGSDSSDYSVHDVTFNVVDTPHVSTVSGSLPAAFGADGPGAVTLVDGPTGLTYNGVAIVNTLVNGILVGMAGDTVVYSLTLSSDGHYNYSYQFDLAEPIDGTQNGTPLAFHYNVTDNDGDTAHGTINVNVTEAAPTATLIGDTILTNSLDGSFQVSDAALLRNDSGASTVTGVTIKGSDSGTAGHDGTTGTTYQFAGGANDFTGNGKLVEGSDWGNSRSNATVISRNSFAQSSTLDTGSLQLTGSIGSSTDSDVFKLHLQAGEVLYGSLFGTGAQKANVEVDIYDSNGNLVAHTGYQTASQTWGYYNVPSDGDYYIVVDGHSGNGNNHNGGTGNYELDLNILSQATTAGAYHYQAGGSEGTVTVEGVSGGASYGHDQHTVQGTNANEILVGDSHQHNYLNGGGGDDWIMYHPGDTVDGGGNSHAGQNGDLGGSYLGDVLDISELSGSVDLHSEITNGHIKEIDTVSMTGGASQSVTLNISDILNIGNGTFHPTSSESNTEFAHMQVKDTVKVEGSDGDSLTLSNSGNGQWVNITSHLSNVPADHQVFAYDQNGGAFHANDVQGYVVVGNNVTVHDDHGNAIAHI